MQYYCYILKNDIDNKTYNGFTVNLNRRIRQHNGLLVGGAKFTTSSRPWKIYAVLTGFKTKSEALSCEWKIKHPTNAKTRPRKYCCPKGRIDSLNIVLNLDTWTSNSDGLKNNEKYTLYVDGEYINIINKENIKKNIDVKNLLELSELLKLSELTKSVNLNVDLTNNNVDLTNNNINLTNNDTNLTVA